MKTLKLRTFNRIHWSLLGLAVLGAAFLLTTQPARRWVRHQVAALGVALLPQEQGPAPPSELAAAVERLSVAVRHLQLELSEMKIEAQQRKVSQAEEEMNQAQTARERLETRRLELEHEISILDSHLSAPELPAEARPELEAQKLHLSGRAQAKLQVEELSAAQREAEVGERLEQERQRLQELTEQHQQLRQSQKKAAGTT
jgi:chromosome segregation ATPase